MTPARTFRVNYRSMASSNDQSASPQRGSSFLSMGVSAQCSQRPMIGWRMLTLLVLAGAGLAAPARADLAERSSESGRSSLETKARPVVQQLARKAKAGKATGDDVEPGAGDSAGAQTGKAKAADDSAAKGDKAGKEPAPKSAGKSGGSLDNLMNDVVSDKASKGKKADNKEMDALLKDVQKSEPAPVAKKAEPVSAPPLAPADISAAMAQVKVRGNACAKKFGRAGTAELKVTVAKDGKVTDVQLSGKLAGTPIADCIDQAVKTASFRANAGLRFDYRMDVR
jgi:hypothetical protein